MSAKTYSMAVNSNPGSNPVRFEWIYPTARKVCIAGSFNGWNPEATPMAAAGGGKFLRELWLPPGTHEYLFVVDGAWVFDRNATDYAPNVFGGMNAVVEVSSALKPSGADTRPAPASTPRRKATADERTAGRVACCA